METQNGDLAVITRAVRRSAIKSVAAAVVLGALGFPALALVPRGTESELFFRCFGAVLLLLGAGILYMGIGLTKRLPRLLTMGSSGLVCLETLNVRSYGGVWTTQVRFHVRDRRLPYNVVVPVSQGPALEAALRSRFPDVRWGRPEHTSIRAA